MVRFKHRYLLCEFFWENGSVNLQADASSLKHDLRSALQHCFGIHGLGLTQSGLNVKFFNNLTNMAIIKAPRDHYRMVWLSLVSLRNLGNMKCSVRVVHIGGSVKLCQKAALEHGRSLFKALSEYHHEFPDLSLSPQSLLDQESDIVVLEP
ncbi:hypothetical protein RCL1_000427 [Eukaryota sp. TZLM3-RCL]